MRQLYFLYDGIGKRLYDKISIRPIEDFAFNTATRILNTDENAAYIDNDNRLYEYRLDNNAFVELYDGWSIFDDMSGGFEAYVPYLNKAYITLKDGTLAALNVVNKSYSAFPQYTYVSVILNPQGSYALLDKDGESEIILWDVLNDSMITSTDNGYGKYRFIQNNIVEFKPHYKNEIIYYEIPSFKILPDYTDETSHTEINTQHVGNKTYTFDIDNSLNELLVFINDCDSMNIVRPSFENSVSKFKRVKFGDKISDKIPTGISPWEINISNNGNYAIVNGSRMIYYIVDLVHKKVIKRISGVGGFDGFEAESVIWHPLNNRVLLNIRGSQEEPNKIIVYTIDNGEICLAFESQTLASSFSRKGDSIIFSNNQSIRFLSYDSLLKYFYK